MGSARGAEILKIKNTSFLLWIGKQYHVGVFTMFRMEEGSQCATKTAQSTMFTPYEATPLHYRSKSHQHILQHTTLLRLPGFHLNVLQIHRIDHLETTHIIQTHSNLQQLLEAVVACCTLRCHKLPRPAVSSICLLKTLTAFSEPGKRA